MTQSHTLIIVSGLSGSGKSIVLTTLEDLGYYCTDNLPVELLSAFIQSRFADSTPPLRLAVGIDVRSGDRLASLPAWRTLVQEDGIAVQLLFFETKDETLLKRYADTRRRHPLSRLLGLPLPDAIQHERVMTSSLRAQADAIIDTSLLNVHQLRRKIITEFALSDSKNLSLLFESFAYKGGVPLEADFVFDARVLANPHWNEVLRPLTGKDYAVAEFLQQNADVLLFCRQIQVFLDHWLPQFDNGSRNYVTVAFGCTGGKHRSVYLAEHFARHMKQQGWPEVATFHRELDAR